MPALVLALSVGSPLLLLVLPFTGCTIPANLLFGVDIVSDITRVRGVNVLWDTVSCNESR